MILTVAGPVFEVSGYGELTRQITFALQEAGIETILKPQFWGYPRLNLQPQMKQRLKVLKKKGQKERGGLLYIGVPLFFQRQMIPAAGLTMSEVEGIPPQWVQLCSSMDRIFVPSRFNLESFSRSGVDQEKIRVLPPGVDHERFTPCGPKLAIHDADSLFTFLSIGEWLPRKGFDILIRAFVQEFSGYESVCLVLKCHNSSSDYDRQGLRIKKEISSLIKKEGKAPPPPVILLPQALDNQDMPSLYRRADCFVLATRGEGWCMPVFEAMACGLPVIITSWSAYMDHLNPENSFLIEVEDLEPAHFPGKISDDFYAGHRWARPSIQHLRYLMRLVFTDYQTAREKALKGQNMVRESLRWDSCGIKIIENFKDLIGDP